MWEVWCEDMVVGARENSRLLVAGNLAGCILGTLCDELREVVT
jgi:hypothetical protein